jgi:hypothetical protein
MIFRTASIFFKIVSLVVVLLIVTLSMVMVFSTRNQTAALLASADQTLHTNADRKSVV